MTLIDRSALLPYRAQQIFELVSDIEAYPQYMDGCVGAEILRREEGVLEARLDLARGGLRHSFSTRNRSLESRAIKLELIDGPFDHFEGQWGFMALGDDACKVSLQIEFGVSGAVRGMAAAKLFNRVTNNLIDALGKRAKQVYG
jgi:ribosome-associated toxin RatA of RatAB toxin-antitoxin module